MRHAPLGTNRHGHCHRGAPCVTDDRSLDDAGEPDITPPRVISLHSEVFAQSLLVRLAEIGMDQVGLLFGERIAHSLGHCM
jgi:hypothetical protein